jgi:uncharacterized protein (DUF3084 family)
MTLVYIAQLFGFTGAALGVIGVVGLAVTRRSYIRALKAAYEARGGQIEARDRLIAAQDRQIEARDRQIEARDRLIDAQDKVIGLLNNDRAYFQRQQRKADGKEVN